LMAQLFSIDSSVSLYPTTQAILFFLIWVALRSSPVLVPTPKTITRTLAILGFLTIVKTLSQYRGALHNFRYFMDHEWAQTYGFLPTNPTFNAIFMSSLA